AWATEAAADGLNILGYFNIDMAGYLTPGDVIHTDIIAPVSASELKQFYKDVCAIYLPDFQTFNGALSGGDSDHTSFNNNGYQGIFPFEDSQNYSPYIHSANDLIGPSVNNFEQHMTFVQATIASVASMASQLQTPENLVAMAGDQQVNLEWGAVEGTSFYNIYKNAEPEPFATATEATFIDTDVVNGTSYTYYVTAVFAESGEESGPSNPVTVIPMPPISLPFFDDFETGAPYWIMEDTWGLQNGTYYSSAFALTESPSGEYAANMDASVTLRALNFTGATSAQISFWTMYTIESGYDYMYLEVSTDGTQWSEIDSYSGNQFTWVFKTYPLDDYLGENNVIIRFRFTSDVYVEEQGMFIDDLEVNVSGVGLDDEITSPFNTNLRFTPNPSQFSTTLNYWIETGGMIKITLTDSRGTVIKTLADSWKDKGSYQLEVDINDLPGGVYYGILESQGRKISRKLVITR
ncbi:MAG: T9SS type A sorting domain-containing protein, partial [Bacteroidales bacterium]|nr:T9SS type A sorting domain-containing protein [Bacteroidales bacterium]